MKRFIIKLAVFSLPITVSIGIILYAGLVLPIDYFTFRSWEALSVYEKNIILSGPFYPNTHLIKTELGDLSGLTKYQIPRETEWYTDRYGYRKKESGRQNFEVVIIGDSSVVGSSLTQEDILSEVMERKLGVGVYPYAKANFNDYLGEKRFKDRPPKVVVVESVEKLVLGLSEVLPPEQLPKKKVFAIPWGFVTDFAVMRDRLIKDTFINYLRARFRELPRYFNEPGFRFRSPGKIEVQNPGKGIRSEMVFYQEPEAYFDDWKQPEINRVVFALKQYRDELSKTGTKLIFMPIPNKENIYWRQVKGGKQTRNLKRLVDAAQSAGIPTVDLWTLYGNRYNQNPDRLLYQTDDTHWNAYGVEVAAEELAKKINEINF